MNRRFFLRQLAGATAALAAPAVVLARPGQRLWQVSGSAPIPRAPNIFWDVLTPEPFGTELEVPSPVPPKVLFGGIVSALGPPGPIRVTSREQAVALFGAGGPFTSDVLWPPPQPSSGSQLDEGCGPASPRPTVTYLLYATEDA